MSGGFGHNADGVNNMPCSGCPTDIDCYLHGCQAKRARAPLPERLVAAAAHTIEAATDAIFGRRRPTSDHPPQEMHLSESQPPQERPRPTPVPLAPGSLPDGAATYSLPPTPRPVEAAAPRVAELPLVVGSPPPAAEVASAAPARVPAAPQAPAPTPSPRSAPLQPQIVDVRIIYFNQGYGPSFMVVPGNGAGAAALPLATASDPEGLGRIAAQWAKRTMTEAS